MTNTNRTTNKYGITDDCAPCKIMSNPAPAIKLQHDQLTKLCEEYQAKRAIIDNRVDLSALGKMPMYDDLKADMNRRLKNMRANPDFKVPGIDEAKAALVPAVPSTGNDVVDHLRDAEIRATIRHMDSATRMAAVVKGTPEMINSLLDSPVPFAEFSNEFLNDCLQRIALEGNEKGRWKLVDLQQIAEQIEANFSAAEKYISNPQF